MQFHSFHSWSTSTMHRLQSESFQCRRSVYPQSKEYQLVSISQEEQINPIPIPTIYTDEQEMLNGNGGSELVPQPQPGMLV